MANFYQNRINALKYILEKGEAGSDINLVAAYIEITYGFSPAWTKKQMRTRWPDNYQDHS